jgi:undecaprenyl-diphosphatase
VAWYTLAACLFALFGGEALPALRHMLVAGVLGVAIYKLLKIAHPAPAPLRGGERMWCAPAAPWTSSASPPGTPCMRWALP